MNTFLLARAAACASFAVMLSGCASTHDGPKPPTLDGTSWRLDSWSHAGSDPRDFEITAEIDGQGVAGKAAVNRYFGPLEHGPDGTFRPGLLGSTMMAGPEDAMQAEQVFLRMMREARRYGTVDDELRIFADDGTQIFSFRPAS